MALNSLTNRLRLIAVFPQLDKDPHFEILSPENPNYNCIAWAMGLDDRRMDPTAIGPQYDWPKNLPILCPDALHPDNLIKAFMAKGFVITQDFQYEEGCEKVFLYKHPKQQIFLHASKLIANGVEYSKFGESFDGTHSSGSLTSFYGVVYACMKRKINTIPEEPKDVIVINQQNKKNMIDLLKQKGLI